MLILLLKYSMRQKYRKYNTSIYNYLQYIQEGLDLNTTKEMFYDCN